MNWDAIREKGRLGLLTADETDALVHFAHLFYSGLSYKWGYAKVCPYCLSRVDEHTCPLSVLEKINLKSLDITE